MKLQFTISKHPNRRRSYFFNVHDDFFKGEIVFKIMDDFIEFRKPTLNDRNNILTSSKHKKCRGFHFCFTSDLELKLGNHNFEEVEDDDFRIFLL